MFMGAVAAIVLGHKQKIFVVFPVLLCFLNHYCVAEIEMDESLAGELWGASDIIEGMLEVFDHNIRSMFMANNEFE